MKETETAHQKSFPHYHSLCQPGQNSDKGEDSYTTTVVVTMVT